MCMKCHERRKNEGIAFARDAVENASNDSERLGARLSLIVAVGKPLGAFESEAREKARAEYNRDLSSMMEKMNAR